jgi:heme/copper-type cytochrome/quinol oxidase subunit 3
VSEKPHAGHDEHDHGHGHGSVFIQHHYDDAQHQFDAGKLGIWLFLAQEVLFFSALFVAYILYRHHHTEIYAYAHKYLDTKMGAINTAVLIFSSLTAAWAVRAAQLRQKKLLIACIATTLACACAFLVIKYFEYTHKIHEHLLFGERFDPCISSGGTPLANMNNSCPGSKSTIQWDFNARTTQTPRGAATEGCFPDVALDLEPQRPGVQLDCKVFEVSGATTVKDGKATFTEKSRKEIGPRCFDPVFGPGGGLSLAPGAEHKDVFPCWKPNHQPGVCRPGWYFRWTCEGDKCKAPAGGEGPFQTLSACNEQRGGKEGQLKADGTPWVSDCSHGKASAFVVEYGDHALRSSNDLRIAVDCKTPPTAAAPADPFAEVGQTPAVGKSQIATTPRPTHADEKAALYAGPPPENTSMFFTIYFAMTGLHGVHVLIGVFIFIWLLIRSVKGHFTPDYFGPIDFAALYWHIVDLIWIFLFPLMYLIH